MEGKTIELDFWETRRIRKINSMNKACQEGFQLAALTFGDKQQKLIIEKEDFFRDAAQKMGLTLEVLKKNGLGIKLTTDDKGKVFATVVKTNPPAQPTSRR